MDFYNSNNFKDWKNELLPAGLAYHNSSLSMSMREMIEEEFRKNDGAIKLIVATETLSIGVNMPADVMILFDDGVYRKESSDKERFKEFSVQEYKNFIGRCGRLGISDSGESWLITKEGEIRKKWEKYVRERTENFRSSLVNKDVLSICPYFLNLLCRGKEKFTVKRISELLESTLGYFDKEKLTSINPEGIVKILEKYEFIKADSAVDIMDMFDAQTIKDDNKNYFPTDFGKIIARYALSVRTCLMIKFTFCGKGNENFPGLPFSYTNADLNDGKFLPDILFRICATDHVINSVNYPRLPEQKPNFSEDRQKIKRLIKSWLQRYKDERGEESFWQNSNLEKFIKNEVDDDTSNATLRAVILTLWLGGKSLEEIKKELNLADVQHFDLYTGDLERLGEVCAYVTEAIANCINLEDNRVKTLESMKSRNFSIGKLKYAFLRLATGLKYGLSDPELLQLAKMNVPGITRKILMKLPEAAKGEGYDSVLGFINSGDNAKKYLNARQLEEFRRYKFNNVKQDLRDLYENNLLPDDNFYEYMRELADAEQKDFWQKSIKELLSIVISHATDFKIDGEVCGCKVTQDEDTLRIIYCFAEKNSAALDVEKFLPREEQELATVD